MLGNDIYCAEEDVFGKGGWGEMGRDLEITCSSCLSLLFCEFLRKKRLLG